MVAPAKFLITLNFLSEEVSGLFVTEVTFVPRLYLPVFQTIFSQWGSLLLLMGAGSKISKHQASWEKFHISQCNSERSPAPAGFAGDFP